MFALILSLYIVKTSSLRSTFAVKDDWEPLRVLCFRKKCQERQSQTSAKHSYDQPAAKMQLFPHSPQRIQKLPGSKTKTTFKKSVPMSTYLVCFAVHQFQFVERTSVRGIPVSSQFCMAAFFYNLKTGYASLSLLQLSYNQECFNCRGFIGKPEVFLGMPDC